MRLMRRKNNARKMLKPMTEPVEQPNGDALERVAGDIWSDVLRKNHPHDCTFAMTDYCEVCSGLWVDARAAARIAIATALKDHNARACTPDTTLSSGGIVCGQCGQRKDLEAALSPQQDGALRALVARWRDEYTPTGRTVYGEVALAIRKRCADELASVLGDAPGATKE